MRKLCASLVLGVGLYSALAHAIPDWIIPSPVSIAIQVGKWILLKDSNDEVYYVRVQSTGASETEARNEAFRLAVDRAVGSLLVSETKILDNKLSHETINYSSGYIHNFEYVNIHRSNNEVVIHLDVWVKKSKIAERIALESGSQGNLEGGRIAESFRSLQEQSRAGDRLLQNILADFPERAVDVQIKKIEYVNTDRKPVMHVNFLVWWKGKYIESLREAMQSVGKEKSADRNYWPGLELRGRVYCNGWFCDDKQYVTDRARSNLIYRGIQEKRPNVLVTILDVHNQSVYNRCWWWDNMQGQGNGRDQLFDGYTTIYYEAVLQNNLVIDLSNHDISKMDKVELRIVKETQCPKN